MTGPRLTLANLLVATIRDVLDGAGLVKAHVTINANEVPSAARYGVIVVSPPDLRFDTWDETEVTWELHVIAGPAGDYLAAWETIDTLIAALEAAHVNLRDGKPSMYQPMKGEPLSAYTLTLNPLD